MDPEGEKQAETEDLKRKSVQLDPEPPSTSKQTKQETPEDSSSDDDPFILEVVGSSDDSEGENLSNSSSDSETQGFDLDGYLKYCKETQDPV